jgi:hypothetical protein
MRIENASRRRKLIYTLQDAVTPGRLLRPGGFHAEAEHYEQRLASRRSPCAEQAGRSGTARPCPRCYVPLVLERQYRSRGLSGSESLHETYICPACDARFQHSPAEGRWREIS